MPEPLHIAFLLFPNVTQLDLTGPVQVLSRLGDATLHLVAKTREPVPTDAGFAILPTATFAEVPAALAEERPLPAAAVHALDGTVGSIIDTVTHADTATLAFDGNNSDGLTWNVAAYAQDQSFKERIDARAKQYQFQMQQQQNAQIGRLGAQMPGPMPASTST